MYYHWPVVNKINNNIVHNNEESSSSSLMVIHSVAIVIYEGRNNRIRIGYNNIYIIRIKKKINK